MGTVSKIPKMDVKRYVVIGHKKDMWFSAQKSKDSGTKQNRIYIRDIFYNEAKCATAVKKFNDEILGSNK